MAFPISRIAILRKVTFLEKLRQPGQTLASGPSRLQALVDDKVVAAHESHIKTTETVCSFLKSQQVDMRLKDSLTKDDIDWAQLVVTLGGDGTFLRTSHYFHEREPTPILGINSSPESSLGFYCAADATSFPALFKQLVAGIIRSRPLWRMRILINGVKHPVLVLNDALFTATNAAGTLYYTVRVGNQAQVQKSSGVWIATPAGSTAGILSAGGCIQPWSSRLLQYRIRELFPPSIASGETPVIGGLFEDEFELIPRMTTAKVYIDGGSRCANVGYNDRIMFETSEQPINWVASPNCDDNRAEFGRRMRDFRLRCAQAEAEFQRQQTELLKQ